MELTMISNWLSDPFHILLSLAICAACITKAYFAWKYRNIPPGPTGLPYLGYWPFLSNENILDKFAELTKKYGDVFSITITGRLYIYLGSSKALRSVHIAKADCFDGRIPRPNLLADCYGNAAGFQRGEKWKVLRRFFLKVMNERVVLKSKNSMLGPVYDSVKSAVDDLKAQNGKPVNFTGLVVDKCLTNLRLMIMNDDGASEEEMQKIAKLNAIQVRGFTPLNVIQSGKFAKYVISRFNKEYQNAIKSHFEIEDILWKILKDHKATYDEDYARDMIDDFLKERDERRRKGDPTAEYFADENLVTTVSQIVADGTMSVASVLSMFVNFLVENPEEQEKIYQEIMTVIGPDREPTIEDKGKLPYLNAFLNEGLRMTKVFTIFPGWECIKETTVNGYRIPKGVMTLMNLYVYKHDTQEESTKFKPCRFMPGEDGRKPAQQTSFGIGKRTCLGEGYSMMQFYLFMANIIQNFELKLPDKSSMSTNDIYMKGYLIVCAHPRKH